MLTITPTRTGLAPLHALTAHWNALCAATHDLYHHWLRHRERQATQRALAALSPRLLRDLGIDRSEIASIAAAAGGLGDPTRVRTTQLARRLTALL